MPQPNPEKSQFKLNEVCAIADTQPYVLRFWESEFPQLSPRKSRGGHPIYTRDDVDLVLRIKRLLHEQEFSLSDAREALERGDDLAPSDDPPAAGGPAPVEPPETIASLESELETTRHKFEELRGRYDAACEEIRRLREDSGASTELVEERDAARREAEALRERLAEVERLEHQLDRTRGMQRERDNELKQLRARVDDLAGTLEETASERDRARERAEAAVAEAERTREEFDDFRAATRGERARLADRLETVRSAFRELTGAETAREGSEPADS